MYGRDEACYASLMAERRDDLDDDETTVDNPMTTDGPTHRRHRPAEGEGDRGQSVGPAPSAADMAYAVHTRTCTYLLDSSGICRWITSRQGAVPEHVRQCMGAQFVACLDLRERGGLVGELRPGAMVLFVRLDGAGRMVLLRTAAIQQVDGLGGSASGQARSPAFGDRVLDEGVHYGKAAGMPVDGPPQLSSVQSWGEEQTVTVHPPGTPSGQDEP